MKKIILLAYTILGLLTAIVNTKAQVSNYLFSQSNGTYTEITGGNSLGNASTDDEVFNNNLGGALPPVTNTGFPIGFNFTYNNVVCDRFAVSANGWIVVGTGTFQIGDQNFFETPISTTGPAGFVNAISALGLDLEKQNGASLQYITSGTIPNRTLTIQWKKFRVVNITGYDLNFQIILHETSNKIDIVYGTMVNPFDNGESAEVGLRGNTNADFNNRSELTNWANTTAGTTNDAFCELDYGITPASGLTFTWTPPAACVGAPTAGVTVTNKDTVCSSSKLSISLTGTSVSSGLSYVWQSSADSLVWSNIFGANNNFYDTTITSTTYFRAIVFCGAFSDTSQVVKVVHTILHTYCYCGDNLGGGCDNSDNIRTVQIVGTPLYNPNTGCDNLNANSYSVYPYSGSTTATLVTNQTYSLKVITVTSNIISAWIDYDHSGTFDASEWYRVNTASTPNVASTISITILGTALLGKTGMRIRSRASGNANGSADACTQFGSGETEDYMITITNVSGGKELKPSKNIVSIYPQPAGEEIFVELTNIKDNKGNISILSANNVEVFSSDIIITNDIQREKIDVSQLASGIYFIRFISDQTNVVQKLIIE